jgi:hypothetical protein
MLLSLEETLERCRKLGLRCRLSKDGYLEVEPARRLQTRKLLAKSIGHWRVEIVRNYLESKYAGNQTTAENSVRDFARRQAQARQDAQEGRRRDVQVSDQEGQEEIGHEAHRDNHSSPDRPLLL